MADSALPATYAIITHEDDQFSPIAFFPEAQELATVYDFENKPYAQIVRIPAHVTRVIQPQFSSDAQIGESARVLGYDFARNLDSIDLRIYWQCISPMRDDYTVFVHLIDSNQSSIVSQDDAQPGHGNYPTSRWRQRETIIDNYHLKINSASENFQIALGMYSLQNGERLPVLVNGQRVRDDALILNLFTK